MAFTRAEWRRGEETKFLCGRNTMKTRLHCMLIIIIIIFKKTDTKNVGVLIASLLFSSGAGENRGNTHWWRINFADVWTLSYKLLFDQFWPHLSCLLKKAKNINEDLWLETDWTYFVALVTGCKYIISVRAYGFTLLSTQNFVRLFLCIAPETVV